MASIADVYVTVLPETGKIAAGIKKALADVDDDARDAAKRWRKEIEAELKGITVKLDVDIDGAQMEAEVEKETRKRKPKIKVEAEVDPDEASMARLKKAAEGLLGKLDMDVDEQVILNKIRKLQGDIQKKMSTIGVTEHVGIAENELRKLRSEVARLLSHIDVDVDTDLAERALKGLDGTKVKVEVDADPTRNLQRGLYGMFAPGNINKFTQVFEKEVDDAKERAELKLKELGREAEYILSRIGIDLDTKGAKAKLLSLQQQAQSIIGKLDINLDDKKALAELHEVTRDRRMNVRVDLDKSSLTQVKSTIQGAFSEIGSAFGPGVLRVPGSPLLIPLAFAVEGASLLPNLVPVIGQVVSAAAQLSGVLGLLPGVAGSAALAVGALKIATSGFADAIKNVGDPEKFAESVAQLAPNAQAAARTIQALMPQITTLKMTVQDAFFAGFGDQIKALGSTYLPMFQTTLSQFAAVANRALTGVSTMLQTPEMKANIQSILDNLARGFNIVAGAVQPVVQAFTDIMTVSASFMPGLGLAVSDMANGFANFIRGARDSGQLSEWIQNGITAFTQLKDIVVNVWDTLKGIFSAAAGPGGAGGLLGNLDNLTQKWSTWVNSDVGQNKIANFFADAKAEFDKWWPILESLPGMFVNAFNAVQTAFAPLMPLIREITGLLERHPGLVWAVVAAWVGFKGVQIATACANIVIQLGTIATALMGLPAVAATAEGGIAAAMAGLPAVASTAAAGIGAAFAALGVITIPVAFATLASPLFKDQGPTSENARARGSEGLALGTATGPDRLPGQNLGAPPQGSKPGDIVPGNTPGAVPKTGTNEWIIPGKDSTNKWVIPTPQSPSGSREPDQGPLLGAPPAAMPTPATSTYVPPAPTPSSGGGGSGGSGSKPDAVSPVPGAGYTYTGFGELNWEALAQAESGGNWAANTGNGFYGGLQFVQGTWDQYGGQQFAKRPDLAEKSDQIKVATALYNKEGAAPWPANGWLLTATPDQLNAAGLTGSGRTSSSAGNSGRGNYGGGYPGSGGMPQPRVAYGLPASSNSGGYGGGGVQFPDWVNQFGADFGVKPSTYPGHQDTNRNEAGYAPNPQHLNRGIDWTGSTADMQKMADYLLAHPELVEQMIFQNPDTGLEYGIAGGKVVEGSGTARAGYYDQTGEGGYSAHRGHVHTRQSESIPEPGAYDGSYNGPGQNRNNPMYTENAKQSDGAQLGKDLVSGVMDIFGVGDLFKDPTQFGLFKIFKGLMGLHPADNGDGSSSSSSGGGNFFGGGGGNGGGDMFSSLMGLAPQAFGALNPGSPDNAPGEFIPGLSEGGGGSPADFMAGFVPQLNHGPGKGHVDNSFHIAFGDTKADTGEVMNKMDDRYLQHNRSALNNVPS